MRRRRILAILTTIIGVGIACVGIAFLSPPLALVVAGVAIAALGLTVEVSP